MIIQCKSGSKVKEDEHGNRVRIIYDRDKEVKVMEWLNEKTDQIHYKELDDQPARLTFKYDYCQNKVGHLYKKEWFYDGFRERLMRDEKGRQLPAYYKFEKNGSLKCIRYYRQGQLHRSFFEGPAVINYINKPDDNLSFKYVEYWYKGKYYPFIFNVFVLSIILLMYCGFIFLLNYYLNTFK